MIEFAGNINASEPPKDFAIESSGEGAILDRKTSKQDRCQKTFVQEDCQAAPSSRAIVQVEKSMGIVVTSSTKSAQSIAKAIDENTKAELAIIIGNGSHNTEEASQESKQTEIKSQTDSISSHDRPRPARDEQKNMTALQRLGVGALGRSKSYTALSSNAISHVGSFDTLLRRSSDQKTSLKAQRSPSMPLTYTFGPDASAAKGSEDTIIPDSEEEGSGVLSELEEGTPKPSINLGRFAFTG